MDGRNYVLEPLTQREAEILHLLAEGLSNCEIAQALVIAPGTVKWYNKQLFSKLGVHSRSQAVDRAREMVLLENTRKASPKEIPQLASPSGIVTFFLQILKAALCSGIPSQMTCASPWRGITLSSTKPSLPTTVRYTKSSETLSRTPAKVGFEMPWINSGFVSML